MMPVGVYDHSAFCKAYWDNVPLGEKPDNVLAKELGVNIRTVYRNRKKRGIPPYRPARIRDHMTDDDIKLSVSECSRLHDVAHRNVTKARKERGVEFPVDCKNINWDEQPLGEISDAELSRKLGVNNASVASARRRRRISPFRGVKDNSPKGINWDEQPLGEESDSVIANRLGVNKGVAYKARKRRGIPPFKEHVEKGINWDEIDFSEPEERIARRLGVTQCSVAMAKLARSLRKDSNYQNQ